MHIPDYKIYNVLKNYTNDLFRKQCNVKYKEFVNKALDNRHSLQKTFEINRNKDTSFVFNVIDKNNKKTTDTLSMENPGVFIRALRSYFIKDKDKKD